jgi:O-antigen/teichoic acid export membrane protein
VTGPLTERETWPLSPDDAHRSRQLAGLAALIEISVQAPYVMSDTVTTIIPNAPPSPLDPDQKDQSHQALDDSEKRELKTSTPSARLRQLIINLRNDHLVRNSLYLMLSSGIQAALGFIFWIVMARLFSTGDVGRASSLVSAVGLIAYFSLFGLNSTLVRFLSTTQDKGALITSALTLVAFTGAAIGLVYIILTPIFAPRLAFVEHQPVLIVGFVLLTAAAAVNLLTDSVFVASRKAGFCALTDGVVGGISKIVFGVVFVGAGAYGLFCASAGGIAAAAVVSIILIVVVFHWQPSLKKPFQTLKPLLRFSVANSLANALELIPTLVVPLVVLDRIGAQAAAYYFLSFQMATLLYSAAYAVEGAFLAEGSRAEVDWRAVRSRSRRLAITLFVPGGAFLALTAHWVLLAFGVRYSQNGTTSLELLACAVIPIAACNWSWTVQRLSGRLTALVLSSVVYAGAICSFAWVLAPHGLSALTAAWPIGSTIAAVIATAFTLIMPSKPSGRHRRTT